MFQDTHDMLVSRNGQVPDVSYKCTHCNHQCTHFGSMMQHEESYHKNIVNVLGKKFRKFIQNNQWPRGFEKRGHESNLEVESNNKKINCSLGITPIQWWYVLCFKNNVFEEMYRCFFPLMYFLPPESHTFHCDSGRAQRFQTDSQRPALDWQGLDMLSYFGDKLVEMQNYYILGWQHHCCSALLDLQFLTEQSFPRNPWKHPGEIEEGGLCTLGFYLFHPIVQHTVSQWVVLESEPKPIICIKLTGDWWFAVISGVMCGGDSAGNQRVTV